ncbi:hypothetical protein COT99_03390 [Candidatus Falkowbacteria bacterium CG10_big_fil_rev_8_21_14_0_10_43_10]|uniref:PEP-utilising enzyme mobile domain-containing protein n=1 Tax=Candidatus Falkowbacteria bacterium CG10_big_fil_rev_8_21_14_0_10_43_10 TaxID=1974567 RepID=A0A2H0V1M9_9BACT|nr:MAG: hypothetical protein COT99_03390 [Candidatus Falkowbacteria bacterium CG10_big_fil_rev_8_21_14_0_10_43_10]
MFGRKMNKKIREHSDKLRALCASIKADKLAKMSNKELADLYKKLDLTHTSLYTWGWLPNAVDMFHGNFTSYLQKELAKKAGNDRAAETLVKLSVFPETTVINKEYQSFLQLAALKQSGVAASKLKQAIGRHLEKYFYLRYLWLGKEGVYTYNYYAQEIDKFIKSGKKAQTVLREEQEKLVLSLEKKQKLLRELKLSKRLQEIINVYAEFAVTKAYRRDAQIFWSYKMQFVFQELSSRLKLSIMQIRFMFPQEVSTSLTQGAADSKLKKELDERTKYSIYYAEKGIDMMFYGPEAETIEKNLVRKIDSSVKEITGQPACLGKVRGRVHIINTPADMAKMQAGDILVSIATNPDIVPAMKKAAAIVTEQGGITSHAAIVSRELGIPCVIGTKIATKVLRDGDLVEVDANKGVVRVVMGNG